MFSHSPSGLYLTKNRAYDPYSGRWLSRDPAGEINGSINLYAYVDGDPTNYADTSGLCGSPSSGLSNSTECTGQGRGLEGNASLVGRQGGIPGEKVQLHTAAVIPQQFGVSSGTALGPNAQYIHGTIGTTSFSAVTDVIGGKSPVPGENVRTALQNEFPGQLILEIPGASDQGANAPVTIFIPAPLGCPQGTVPAPGK